MPRTSSRQPEDRNQNKSRYADLETQKDSSPAWSQADPTQLGEACIRIAELGDAILIAATSDGGALKLLILANDGKHSHYPSDAEAVDRLTARLAKLQE